MFQGQNDLPNAGINSNKPDFVNTVKRKVDIPDLQKISNQVKGVTNSGKQFFNQPVLPNEPTIFEIFQKE